MKTTSIIFGVFLTVFGIYSIYAAIKNKKSIHFEMPSTTWLPEKNIWKTF
jgi:hypothetical protein